MLHLDCQHDPVRPTEHFRGKGESEKKKRRLVVCCVRLSLRHPRCPQDDEVEEFFQQQRGLLERLPPGTKSAAYWSSYYSRPGAPAASETDAAIRRQLQSRELCRNITSPSPWSRQMLIEALRAFVRDVYPRRPNKDNNLGIVDQPMLCYAAQSVCK